MQTIDDLWKRVLSDLNRQLSSTVVSTWFDEVIPVSQDCSTFFLYCPNTFKRENIERFFTKNLQKALALIFLKEIKVSFISSSEYNSHTSASKKKTPFPTERLTFSSFVVGDSNRIAYNAAQAVAAGFFDYCNPLVIYGHPGVGKTHLLNAIATSIKSDSAHINITHLRGDEFTNELIDSIKNDQGSRFRNRYRTSNVFLMDDIQFIAGKTHTQEEFYNTFTSLYEKGCSIVLTMDRPPRELKQLEERLISRFEGGLMAEIKAPDYDTRLAIIQQKAAERELLLSHEDKMLLAKKSFTSVRQLEGALNRLKAHSLSGDSTPFKDIIQAENSSSVFDSVECAAKEVSLAFQLSEKDLSGKSQRQPCVLARQVLMYVLYHRYHLSEKQIGKELNRDKSTVTYALKAIERKLQTDCDLVTKVSDLLHS